MKDIRSIIAFEAQQNIPFPLQEVIWDYQILRSFEENFEVFLVAGKKKPLLKLRKELRETGFLLARMEIASTALYNALRFNYAEVSECSLLLDIGYDSINLIFSEKEFFFTRTISKNILNLVEENFLIHPGFSITFAKKASLEIENLIKKISAEIHRSISFYCNHHRGKFPARIFLCGDSASVFQEKLKTHLQLPIDFFYPFQQIKIPSTQIQKISVDTLGEIVGLATHGLKNAPLSINLFATEFLYETAWARRKSILIASILFLIFTLLVSWLYLLRMTSLKVNASKKNQEKNFLLEDRARRFDHFKIQSEKMRKDIQPLIQAVEERLFWPQLMNILEKSLPSKFIWVTRLESMSGNKMILFSPKVIRIRDTPDAEHWAYRYALMLPLCLSQQRK